MGLGVCGKEKPPPPLSFAASELWLISHSGRESEAAERMRMYSACFSWMLHFPSLNTEINLRLAAKMKPPPLSLPSKDFLGVIDFLFSASIMLLYCKQHHLHIFTFVLISLLSSVVTSLFCRTRDSCLRSCQGPGSSIQERGNRKANAINLSWLALGPLSYKGLFKDRK